MNKMEAKAKTHKREHVLVDVKVEADLSSMIYRSFCKDVESEVKELERAAKEFHDFLRDHRSQDMVTLNVEKIYKNLCLACGEEWETYEENGKTYCASCGNEVEGIEVEAKK